MSLKSTGLAYSLILNTYLNAMPSLIVACTKTIINHALDFLSFSDFLFVVIIHFRFEIILSFQNVVYYIHLHFKG